MKAKSGWSEKLSLVIQRAALRCSRVPSGHLVFVCNLCGAHCSANLIAITDRELPTCHNCRSSIRFRALIAALEERLFHNVVPLVHLEVSKGLKGVGMSDEELYSRLLEEKFTYLNTFLHTEPRLDIASPPESFRNRFDFVICAEVMEHVRPPIETAFRHLHSLLRPSGLLVLSVPFVLEGETREHFPDLYKYDIVGKGKDRYLVNVSQKGERQVFRNLIFHGGKGETLEMRLFSRAGLLTLLEQSGFREIEIHSQSMPQWGIINISSFSLPVTAIAS